MKYTILNGCHYSWPPHFRPHFGITEKKFSVCFSPHCLYRLKDTDDYDLNKLIGWSYGLHHQNSIRIAWRPGETGKHIELYFYSYNSDKRSMSYFASIHPSTWNEISIKVIPERKRAYFTLYSKWGSTQSYFPFVCPSFKCGYFLYPYFGGNKTAPRDMEIEVIHSP